MSLKEGMRVRMNPSLKDIQLGNHHWVAGVVPTGELGTVMFNRSEKPGAPEFKIEWDNVPPARPDQVFGLTRLPTWLEVVE